MNGRVRKDIIFFMGVELLFFSTPLYMTYLPAMESETVCRAYILAMNLLTCVFSWYAFAKIAGNAYVGLAGNLCYTCSIYSMFVRYEAGVPGEMAAYAFAPLILCGLWKLASGSGKEKGMGMISAAAGILGIWGSGISALSENVLLYRIWPGVVVLWSLGVCLAGKYIYNNEKKYFPVFLTAVVVFNIFGGMYYMNQLLYFPERSGIL